MVVEHDAQLTVQLDMGGGGGKVGVRVSLMVHESNRKTCFLVSLHIMKMSSACRVSS